MKIERMPFVNKRRVFGEVEFNDGTFAVVQTFGIEGIDRNILLESIQLHPVDMDLSTEQFRALFQVGDVLDIRVS